MKNNINNKIKNIGILWEGELRGGVDTYLYNLINTESFSNINIVVFTNKNNLGAKALTNNLGKKKVSFVYFNSINQFTARNIFFKILLFMLFFTG